jgi:hypothetical protein
MFYKRKSTMVGVPRAGSREFDLLVKAYAARQLYTAPGFTIQKRDWGNGLPIQ